jgi:hypothetical protein
VVFSQELEGVAMRLQVKAFVFAAIVAILGAKHAESAQPQFAVTIVSSNDAISAGSGVQKAGSPIFLLVTLTNNSTRTVSVPSFDRDYYTIDVRDEHGKSVPETDEARKTKEAMKAPNARMFRSGVTEELKPHKTSRHTIDVSQYLDVSRPGKYTIQATRQLPEELGPGVVKSNTITVTVTP